MGLPYRARVDERWFLDLPGGYDDGRYVFAYVEDTSERDLPDQECDGNFEPRAIVEVGDFFRRYRLDLVVGGENELRSSLHVIDTLVAALRTTRTALVAEAEEYDRRERLLDEQPDIGDEEEQPDIGDE